MLDCIKEVHSVGRIYRDVKPDNFRVDKDKVFIIDFGTILKYKNDEGKFIIEERFGGFIGSHRFCSMNAHSFKSLTLRDDLESLGYTALFLLLDSNKFWFASESLDHKYYLSEKKSFLDSTDLDPHFQPIQTYLKEV